MRLQWKKIFLIGLGFFTVTLAWAVYNAYVPIFLGRMIKSSTIIGFIMTVDNIFGVVFQPMFGNISDKTNHRLGRRMPYLLIGIPVSAVFFSIIPLHAGLFTLMLAVIGMNFFMSIYRAPVVALMPDSTPMPLRSKANGIINFMGGLGAVLAFFFGGKLFNLNEGYPFFMVSILMVFALILLAFFFKEPRNPYEAELADPEMNFRFLNFKNPEQSMVKQNPSLLYILLAIFFWFCGYNCIETFFTLYSQDALGLSPGNSSQMLAVLAGTFLVFAIPAGYIGMKLGRKRTMLIGLFMIILSFIFIIAFPSKLMIMAMFILSGVAWALININSYPSVVEMAPEGQTGKYTGFYYAFSFAASIASPILFGVLSDLLGSYKLLFVYGLVAFTIATLLMLPTKGLDSSMDEHELKSYIS